MPNAVTLNNNHNNNQRYLVRVTLNSKPDKTRGPHFRVELEFGEFVFVEGGKPENPEKTLGAGTRTNNKLNPHVTPGPGIEPGPQRWEASALTTAPSLFPPCSYPGINFPLS